jgi:hypothetical protein
VTNFGEKRLPPKGTLQEERLHLELLRISNGCVTFLSEILGYQQADMPLPVDNEDLNHVLVRDEADFVFSAMSFLKIIAT